MKKQTLLFLLFLGTNACFLWAQTSPLSIIPKPAKMTVGAGKFTITAKTVIHVPSGDNEVKKIAEQLADRLKIDGTMVAIKEGQPAKDAQNVVVFSKLKEKELPTEGYRLSVSSTQINVAASTNQGLFYGLQTLLQLLPAEILSATKLPKKATWMVSAVQIEDAPRFPYRGLHLDAGRHFQPVAFVKKYIDLLALHKMNTFHWHLTEDQGWRIEIKKYPKLTQIGSKRKETLIGHGSERPFKFDGKEYGGFYTQEQIKEIVAYAKERYITVVPEIEMPGHALAALAAYPELSCDSTKKYEVATRWGVFEDVFCPTEKTFTFLEDVLTEVMALFPSKYIHIGGDECPKEAWKKSAFCQNLIKSLGLKDEHELQSYFIQRIEKFLNGKGRQIIGWDEILEGGLAPNATVMSWRGIEGGIAAAKENHDVIMTPGSHLYLDYYQGDPATEPLGIGGFLTVEKVYSYEPIPKELNAEQAKHVLGAQGNVWTEYMRTTEHIEYMVYPRASAVAEVVWSPKEARNYDDFQTRLLAHFKRLDALKVNYAKRIFDVKIGLNSGGTTPSVSLTSPVPKTEMRYTTDGTEPKLTSNLYAKPFTIDGKTTVKAAVFQNGKMLGKSTAQTFYKSAAFGLKYTFKNAPKNTYESGEFGLTNGVRGNVQNYAQWVGFNGNDLDVTFDLGTPRALKNVTATFGNRPGAYIFLPDFVTVSVSNDGKEWLDVNRADLAHLRTDGPFVQEVNLSISEYTSPKRYVRLYAKNIGVCPPNHPGAGKAAWLFVDEILFD